MMMMCTIEEKIEKGDDDAEDDGKRERRRGCGLQIIERHFFD